MKAVKPQQRNARSALGKPNNPKAVNFTGGPSVSTAADTAGWQSALSHASRPNSDLYFGESVGWAAVFKQVMRP